MTKVEVRLYGSLRERLAGDEVDRSTFVELRSGTTIAVLLEGLEIPAEEVVVTLVNGIAVDRKHSVKNGDMIHVFPPPIGG